MEIKLIDHGANKLPQKAHANDAGYDVFIKQATILAPNSVEKIPLGFGVQVPAGFMAVILPRSSYASKGVLPQMPPIDSGYTGEVHAITLNATNEYIKLDTGTKIGQLVFIPIYHFDLVLTESQQRGQDAFGSTGK